MKHSITKALLFIALFGVIAFSAQAKKGNSCSLSVSIPYTGQMVCNGTYTGSLWATVSGGTPPYTYSWSPVGGTKDTATGLAGGSYTVYVTDFAGCSDSAVGYINTDNILVTTTSDTICGGSCNGTLSATGYGGTAPYIYSWSNGGTTASLTNLCAGTYTITFMDADGCQGTAVGAVATPANIPGLVVTPTITNSTCPATYDGSLVLNATASTSPFRYEWNSIYSSNARYNIESGTYDVIIWDSKNNCNALSYTVGSNYANCAKIYGTTFNDTNFNCTYDAGESGINCSYLTINPGSLNVYPSRTGYYTTGYLPYGSYTVTQTMNSGSPFAGCSTTLPVTVSSSTPSTDFPDTTHAKLSDPEVTYVYTDIPEPGHSFSAQLQIKNIGADTSAGMAFVTIPDSMTFVSTTPAYSSVSHDTIFWIYTGLLPGDTNNYSLNCVAYGIPLTYTYCSWVNAGVISTAPESNTTNDIWGMGACWVASMDPNYKAVSPQGTGPQGFISLTDSILTYTIHFQNTGTAAANNIYVLDTIDSHLDINTLDVLGSSKSYSYKVTGNVIKFIFSNINLPDSTVSPSGSQAWIQYRLKQKSSNKAGDVIHNTGYVYFDYNAPVVTNTTTNTIQAPLGISSKSLTQPGFSIYPNPASSNVQLSYTVTKPSFTQIQIIDLLGKVVVEENKGVETTGTKTEILPTTMLAPGTYFIKLTSNNVSVNKKLVIIR